MHHHRLVLICAAVAAACAALPAHAQGAAASAGEGPGTVLTGAPLRVGPVAAVYWAADGVRLGRPAAWRSVAWVPAGFGRGPVLRAAWAPAPAVLPALAPVDVEAVVDRASRDWTAQLLGSAVPGLD